MLFSEPTQKGVGIALFGDVDDLRDLHETVHALCHDGAAGHDDQQTHALSLAYEVRKAYEGQREERPRVAGQGRYYGFRMTWPAVLFHASYLRQCAAFRPTRKDHHANLYRLEHCIESALLEYDPKVGAEVLRHSAGIGFVSKGYVSSFVDDVAYQYIYEGGSGKMRFRRLPQLLRTMAEWSEEYRSYAQQMQTLAARHQCSVYQLRDTREWSDFDW